jgi:hypothetical protein
MSVFTDIVTEKCPKCGKGHVFAKKGNPLLLQMPRMETNCPVCGHKFGYFFGSMFVSYALTVGEMIIVFLILQFFTSEFAILFGSIAFLAVLFSTFNFRFSRMLWIYMFDGKDRSL